MVYYRNAKNPAKYDPLDQKQTRVPDVPEMPARRDVFREALSWFFFILFCLMGSLIIAKWTGLL